MPFTPAQQAKLIEALSERMPTLKACDMCGRSDWTLSDQFIPLTFQSKPGVFAIGGPALPVVALSCTHCGNTRLFNLVILGLRELVESAAVAVEP